MLQNPCKTLGFKKNMVFKISPGGGGGVNHNQPVAYEVRYLSLMFIVQLLHADSLNNKLFAKCL